MVLRRRRGSIVLSVSAITCVRPCRGCLREASFRASLRLAVQMREIDKIAYLLEALSGIAVTRRAFIHAARLLAAGEALWNTIDVDSFRRTVEVAFLDNE